MRATALVILVVLATLLEVGAFAPRFSGRQACKWGERLEIRTSVPLLGRKKLSEGGASTAKSGPKAKKDDSKVGPKTPKAKPVVGKAKLEPPEVLVSEEEELDALLKMDGMFPPAGGLELDEMGDADLAEALREIESGDLFGIDDLFSGVLDDAGAKGTIGGAGKSTGKGKSKKPMPDDDLGDLDLLAAFDDELGADVELELGGKVSKGRRGGKKSDNLDPELLEAFGVSKDEFAAIEAAEAAEAAGALIGGGAATDGSSLPLNLDIDGLDLDSEEFSLTPGVGGVTSAIVGKEGELATELPPLEEFKRLLDSLGPDNMFSDDLLFGLLDEPDIDEEMVLSGKQLRDFDYKQEVLVEMRDNEDGEGPVEYHDGERWNGEELPAGDLTPRVDPDEKDPYYDVYAPNIYDGGRARSNVEKYKIDPKVVTKAREFNRYLYAAEPDEAIQARVRIVSVVTNSTRNSTALEIVQKVYDYIKAGTVRDKDKIEYEIHCYKYDDDSEGVEPLDDMIQMWIESYNTYHLVDGAAMKEAWGYIMPHIMLSDKNLRAILDQVQWALHEDSIGGALLPPRMRRIRLRGGAQEMVTGYNTENLDSEFSVVSVR